MPGDLHEERLQYAKAYFKKYNSRSGMFSQIEYYEANIQHLPSKLKKITTKSEGIIPDLIMLSHNYQYLDLTKEPPQVPEQINLLWIEVFDTSFRGFPYKKDIIKALYHTLKWKDLYDQEKLRDGIFGQRLKIEQSLYDLFKHKKTHIYIDYFLVLEESIWKCEHIDKQENSKYPNLDDL